MNHNVPDVRNNNMGFLLSQFFSSLVNQSIANTRKQNIKLPQDQQEALDKILEAIHNLNENWSKIAPQYKPVAFHESILKVAAETGWNDIRGTKP